MRFSLKLDMVQCDKEIVYTRENARFNYKEEMAKFTDWVQYSCINYFVIKYHQDQGRSR